MPDINPQEFGRMKEQIEQLQKSQDELSKDMKAMLALANQGKGGFLGRYGNRCIYILNSYYCV